MSAASEWRNTDLPPGSLVIERYVYTSPRGKTGVQWLAQVVDKDGLLLLIGSYRTRRQAIATIGRFAGSAADAGTGE